MTVLNCNEGENASIMEASGALRGFSHLVALERGNRRALHMEKRQAARAAVDRCIGDGYLVDYLTEHRAEVEDMMFTIQDEERAMRVHEEAVRRQAAEEGRAEGLAEGRAEGRRQAVLESLARLMESAGCDADAAMEMLQVPQADRAALKAGLA